MRINVYSQELTDEVGMIEKVSNTGLTYSAVEVALWNELTDMILEWEDGEGDETAGSLARRIIAIFRRESESLLSDRAKLARRVRMLANHGNCSCAECKDLDALNRSTDRG